jgi:hypothetical protein
MSATNSEPILAAPSMRAVDYAPLGVTLTPSRVGPFVEFLDIGGNMPIDPAVAYNTLLANPGEFLKRYPVRIFGATLPSGVTNYFLFNRGASMRPGSRLGTLRMHATESFDIRAAGALAGALPGAANHPFLAHSVHMDVGAAAMGFYHLPAGAPNIMVTGQLSGCSFVMVPAGVGQVDVAHVQPQNQTGQALYGNITGAIPNAQVYGASGTRGNYDSADRRASIIGVFAAGQWRIYAQKQEIASGDYHIKSVYQIYPNRQKL